MAKLDGLDRGDKQDIHITLYSSEVDVLDYIRDKHNCSRAAVIGELLVNYAKTADISDQLPAGRRPGGGRKKKDLS